MDKARAWPYSSLLINMRNYKKINMNDYYNQDNFKGFSATLAAFLLWGLLPIYWQMLKTVPALEILCHRIVWSTVFAAAILTYKKGWAESFRAVANLKCAAFLTLSSLLVGSNWFVYIWSVNHGHMVDASLGYYINPLVNVILGVIFFRDRLNRLQLIAIGLACLGVANQIAAFGQVPWIALSLALSFGFYGLVRKVVDIGALSGLFFEALVLTPVAGGYLIHLALNGQGAFNFTDLGQAAILVGAGPMTATPLILFAFGARRLSLITVGVVQYLSPTCMFLLGVLVYGEPFGNREFITFALIWAGIAFYTYNGIKDIRQRKRVGSR